MHTGVGGSGAQGDPQRIHRRIAAAEHDDLAAPHADRQRAQVGGGGVVQNKRISLANPAQLRAGNFQRHRFRAAQGKEHRVGVAPQFAQRHIPPANQTHAELDIPFLQELHPPRDHRPVHLKPGQPVDQPSARGVCALSRMVTA